MHLRLLWADDQPAIVEALKPYVGLDAPSITVVETATAAAALLDSERFNLCLLDLQMPPGEWGGLDLLRSRRELAQGTPVVVLSGAGTIRECIEAQRLGARAYVQKENAAEELAGVIQDALVRARADAGATDYARIAALERRIHQLVFRGLGREANRRGGDVFVVLVPKKVALKSYDRMLDQGGGRQEDFLDLVDLREILDALWMTLPEARALDEVIRPKNKEARTSWLADLNELRKVVMHPTRGQLDTSSRSRLATIESLMTRWEAEAGA